MSHPLSSFLRVVDPASPCTTYPSPEELTYTYPYPLDPFQQHAVSAIHREENVLVTAKTGSGKTLVGEYQIAYSLAKGRRVFYTTPIKSLSNQKFYDLKRMFPDRVGIMTGDVKFRPDAPVVILTTEILRNLLFKQGTATEHLGLTADLSLTGLDAVVFDECHYINDHGRGAVWEETLVLLPPEVRLILLSATIDAPEQFASWLGDLKQRPIHLLSTQYRIVPLVHGVYRGDEFLTVMDSKDRFEPGLYKAWLLWRRGQADEAAAHKDRVTDRRRGGYEDATIKRGADGGPKSFLHQMNAMIRRLQAQDLLPALFFVFSRRDCERYAKRVEDTFLDSSDTAAVRHILDFHLHKYGEELQRLEMYHTLRALLEKGIAFHHSGLLPCLKEIIEILFGRGLVKLLFATETFAVGINMPTKTVLFTSFRKYDDRAEGMRLLNTDEYIQMAGRAGRRGKDTRGVVLYLPDREPEGVEDLKRMLTGRRSTFQSRMTFGYDFMLKTLHVGSVRWKEIFQDSYWFKQHQHIVEACEKDLVEAKRQLAALGVSDSEQTVMEEGEQLAQRVKETVNAARRSAQRELEAWKQKRVGPRWYALEKDLWPRYKRLVAEIDGLEHDLVGLRQPQTTLEPRFEAMRRLGFLAYKDTDTDTDSLSRLGRMATEVNEGHCIRMPRFYESGLGHTMEPRELLATLAVFADEGSETAEVEAVPLPKAIQEALEWMKADARACAELEGVSGAVPPKESFWDVNTLWVGPVWAWLQGSTTLSAISAEFGLYEGNVIRILSKLTNLLEEWRSMASLNERVDILDRLRDTHTLLLTGIAQSDSLYLRLS